MADWAKDFFARVDAFMARVLKLKAKMLERKLTFAKTNCTIGGCDGLLHVRLAGRKNHAHAWCSKCDLKMME